METALFNQAGLLFETGEYQKSNKLIKSVLENPDFIYKRDWLIYMYGFNLLKQKRFDTASEWYRAYLSDDVKDPSLLHSGMQAAQRGKELSKKSPGLAALFSAVLPGSGKWYTHQRGDGFYALLMISLTGYLSYEGFQTHGIGSFKGWLFGGLSGIFYGGTLYGSYWSAIRFNERQYNVFLTKTSPEIKMYVPIRF
jgi:hypothetical protein